MSPKKKQQKLLTGPTNISEHLWHYDGANTYKEFGTEKRRGWFGGRHSGATQEEKYLDKLSRYMSAGGMRHETTVEDERDSPTARRRRVEKGLIALAVIWLIFRFVKL